MPDVSNEAKEGDYVRPSKATGAEVGTGLGQLIDRRQASGQHGTLD